MSDVDDLISEAENRRALPTPAQCRERRIRAGLSLDRVAGAIGVSKTTLHEYEHSHRRLPGAALAAYRKLIEAIE